METVRHAGVAIDLFAGVGGMSLGFEQAGFDVVAAVESDEIHASVFEKNFARSVVISCDVAALTGPTLLAAAGLPEGSVDVVFGGPPCQGFSTMGRRDLEDQRNWLIFEFARMVLELRPRYFVMENVPGLLSAAHSGLIRRWCDLLQAGGYEIISPISVLDAADFGVPQHRKRVFVIGCRPSEVSPDYPHPDHPDLPKMLRVRPNVADALGDLPDPSRDGRLSGSNVGAMVLGTPSPYAAGMREANVDSADLALPRQVDRGSLNGHTVTRHSAPSIRRFQATKPGTYEPVSKYFRLDLGGLSHTLRAGTGRDQGSYTAPRPIHPSQPRCITVREAARLHSFPDWFHFHRTIWHGFREVGNSVPPSLARAVALRIRRALLASPEGVRFQ